MGGMTTALNAAVSSLLTTQAQMSTTSANIANAQVAGYTEKTVQVSTNVANGEANGVIPEKIINTINQYLAKEIVGANSQSNYASAYSSYFDTLQNAMGQITSASSGGNDLASELTSLASAITSLAGTPTDTAEKSTIVNDLSTLCSNLNGTSQTVQGLRTEADSDISSSLTTVNTALSTISTLNSEILAASARGEPTADLQDKRLDALNTVSANMNVNYYISSSGAMNVMTAQGQYLVDNSSAYTLSHSAQTLTADSVYTGQYPNSSNPSATTGGNVDGIWLGGTDITNQITGGSIGAAINMRDTQLTAVQSSLDNLASTVGTALNSVYNQAAVSAAGGSLTSSQAVAGSVTVSAGMAIRFAQVNSSGVAVNGAADLSVTAGTYTPAGLLAQMATDNPSEATYNAGTNTLSLTDSSGNPIGTVSYDSTTGTFSMSAATGTDSIAVTTLSSATYTPLGIAAGTLTLGTGSASGSVSITNPPSMSAQQIAAAINAQTFLTDVSASIVGGAIQLKSNDGTPVTASGTGTLAADLGLSGVTAAASTTATGTSILALAALPNTPGTMNGVTFGAYAHLNDLVSIPAPQTSVTSSAAAAQTGLTVSAGTKIQIGLQPSSSGAPAVTVDLSNCTTSAQIAAAINTALAGSSSPLTRAITCSEAGGVFTLSSNNNNYSLTVNQAGGSINSQPFTTYAGLNMTPSSAATTISVASALLASPSSLEMSGLTQAQTTPLSGAVVMGGAGDTTVIQAMETAMTSNTSFAAAGNLGATSQSLSGYAGSVITDVATNASNASSSSSAATSSLTTLQNTFSNESGVNVNQESANLVSLQNSYAAAAKCISIIQTMFQDLVSAMGA